ncbi:hypothetical protein Purlil1_13768 [Purpureocillium lilacinum]|uniref:SWIRM domain-containing protein n=1 Tax=Purpureocillium lilacinum TaxID=33203 RepID=A0ABR0BDB4_PURLI|nr:hypothetical protein Purlil1_13768 [Purpureocillium lilacinum]
MLDCAATVPVGDAASIVAPWSSSQEPVLQFRSSIMKHYIADRKGWLRKHRDFLESDRRHRMLRGRSVFLKPGDRLREDLGYKTRRQEIANSVEKVINSDELGTRDSETIDLRHVVLSKNLDTSFEKLPDYCPSTSTLDHQTFAVEWKGHPIDLSTDPHHHLLHPQEIALAATLRLDCATYLTSKRRIFERRLQKFHYGKPFRKTDAQQACRIDVNKASKLWTAFEAVGWLRPERICELSLNGSLLEDVASCHA